MASLLREDLFFLVTNRLPRRLATRFMGWFSRIEHPWVRDLSLAAWTRFADLRLHEARKRTFASVHDCFTRELREGARPIHAGIATLVSPCDGIVGASGRIAGTQVLQAKGMPYTLQELLGDDDLARQYADGVYVTLRLTSSMYHRFHAPADGIVRRIVYLSGDTWNVHPIALARVERLFCRNERAVVSLDVDGALLRPVLLVAVAAILVAGIRLHCLPHGWRPYRPGIYSYDCSARYTRGQELGWFEHGSTIIVLAPPGFDLMEGHTRGDVVRMGEPLLRLANVDSSTLRPGRPRLCTLYAGSHVENGAFGNDATRRSRQGCRTSGRVHRHKSCRT